MNKTEKNNLYNTTIRLLRKDLRPLYQIANETKLSYHWLCKLKRGSIRGPGVDKIQPLYEFLSGKKLQC